MFLQLKLIKRNLEMDYSMFNYLDTSELIVSVKSPWYVDSVCM